MVIEDLANLKSQNFSVLLKTFQSCILYVYTNQIRLNCTKFYPYIVDEFISLFREIYYFKFNQEEKSLKIFKNYFHLRELFENFL